MGFTPHAGIAILYLFFYNPTLALALWDYRRKNQTAWLDLSLLAFVRIVGAIFLLAHTWHELYGLQAVAMIAEHLSVMLMVCLVLAILERLNNTPTGTTTTTTPHLSPFYFRVPAYLTCAAMGFSLAGYVVVSKRKGDALLPTGYTTAGTAINIALYAWTVLIFVLLWQRHRTGSGGIKKTDEVRQMVVGVARCLPLIGVRMVYWLIFVATMNTKVWHPLVGKWAIYFLMAALPELVVLGFVIATLMRIPPVPKTVGKEGSDVEFGAGKEMDDLPEYKQDVSKGSSVTAV